MVNFSYIFIAMILAFSALNAEDFISKSEYAKMLYANPRGIGCDKCHGAKGEGKVIASYKVYDKASSKMQNKKLIAPQINKLEYKAFYEAVRHSKGMMPSYFLTDNEIFTLYEYLQSLNKEEK